MLWVESPGTTAYETLLLTPLQPKIGTHRNRVTRGGSFYSWGLFARSAFRMTRTEEYGLNHLEFRVVPAPADLATP